MPLHRVLKFAQQLVAERVQQGDVVIDATLGNGYDTAFLANLVGKTGKVYGFDIQEAAIRSTTNRLQEEGLKTIVECFQVGHENIESMVNTPIAAVMFNLGYLPGSAKDITTIPGNTIKALEASLKLLKVGGIITIVLYIEHDKGHEANEVERYLKTLPQKEFQVLKYGFINQLHYPPFLIAIERIK